MGNGERGLMSTASSQILVGGNDKANVRPLVNPSASLHSLHFFNRTGSSVVVKFQSDRGRHTLDVAEVFGLL